MASFDNEHTRAFAFSLAAATVAAFLQPQAIASVPQILGLVATAEPTRLKCADGICSAEFGSFCLQRDRAVPASGTEYRVAQGSALGLVYSDASGAVHEIDATPYVNVDSERKYAAVRISVPESALEMLGATTAALNVGEHASAVPAAVADDRSPFTMAEIRRVTGSLRQLAERLFNADSDTTEAAATALKLVNATDQGATHIDVNALWQKALGKMPRDDAHPAIARVADSLDSCRAKAGGSLSGRLAADCLQTIHEASITRANMRVWDGLEAGT